MKSIVRSARDRFAAVMVMLMGVSACHAADAQPTSIEEKRTFAEIAVKAARPPGFPPPSAVCFSSRWKHPRNPSDPYDSFKAAAGFHATGFYWSYGPDQEWFREIKRHGYTVQGWLSTILPDTLFGNTRQKGRIMNEKGGLVTGPWMLSWKGWWGCFNSPEYRDIYLQYVKMYLDAGVDSLHMDDPGENYTAVQWGGCYCPYCRAKAAKLGKSPRDIQKESTEEFYRYIRAEMDAYAKRHVPFSCNSHPGNRYFFDETFDFGLEELDHTTPCSFYNAMRDAGRRGKAQMYTFRSTSVTETRQTIALAYACGSHIIVPWDVYMPGPNAPRYFGKPEEYADIYGFARANAPYLDGYEDAAFLIPEAPDERYPREPVSVIGGSKNLNLFVRAVPGQPDAPVVIHCLDLSETPRSFRLRLNPARLFGDRPIKVDLLTPAPYDAAAHEHAEHTKNFAALSVTQRLASGCVTEVRVPQVAPWGLVVITPDPDAPRRIWPPSIMPDGASAYSPALSVTMECATGDAVMRYTLDGTEPNASSPRFDHSIVLTGDTTVKARAFIGSAASDCTTVSFAKTAHARAPVSPETVAGLCLWLRADDLLASHKSGDLIAQWPAQTGPAMVAEPVKLYNGRMSTAPVLEASAINHQPAIRFKSGTDLLVIPGFADQHLKGAFTIFMVTRAADKLFGACGNSRNGNGGTPRLYLMRETFTYNASSINVGAAPDTAALLAYAHDGINTAEAWLNGTRTATGSGASYAPVKRFGGGHFAIPFWCGNEYHGGDVAEVIVFDRCLDRRQREGIGQYLAAKYRIRTVRMWE
jgi:Chitobiase/beta-hexosaminidase C-terminal domain